MQCQQQKFADVFSSDSYNDFNSSNDAVLRTEDGGKFDIHKILVADRCPFFKALFSGHFADGTDVLLKGIDAETLDCILVYLYSGNVRLNDENVADICFSADYLLIDPLLKECRFFYLRNMATNNCLSIFLTAYRIQSLGILKMCLRFILIHFEEVLSISEQINILPEEALQIILREETLNVSEERTVWDVIVEWVKFDLPDRLQFVPELLRCISLEDADIELANDIMLNNIVKENYFCRELIFSELQEKSCLQKFRQILNLQSVITGSLTPTYFQVIMKKNKNEYESSSAIYLTFDGEIDYWRYAACLPFFPDCLVHLGHYVYIFNNWRDKIVAFNLVLEELHPMEFSSKSRFKYTVVSLNGFIYFIGGFRQRHFDFQGHGNEEKTIERYDPSTEKWEMVTRMNPMTFLKAVTINGYIYAMGYDRDNQCEWENPNYHLIVQVYDPATDTWSNVSCSRPFGSDIMATVFRGHLYIFGWRVSDDGPFSWESTDEYDPENDVWIPMPHLPFLLSSIRAIVLKDVLICHVSYVFHKICPPVYWDSANRKWQTIEESSPLRMIHMYMNCNITEPSVVDDIVKRDSHKRKIFLKSSFV